MLETPSIDQKKFRLFFWLGFLFLLLLAIGLVFNSEIVTTRFGDTTYHLLTAQGFARADGITLQSTWESLPDGRAQLYPPLYHVLLAGLVKLNLAPLTIIRGGRRGTEFANHCLVGAGSALWLATSVYFFGIADS